MHDSFEKEVQKKMEEMSLSPSAPVWQKIEEEIRPEKKRRRFFFWLLLPAMAGAGAWWYATHPQSEQEDAAPTTKTQPGKISPDTVSTFHQALVTAGTTITAGPAGTNGHANTAEGKIPLVTSTSQPTGAAYAASNKGKKPAPFFNSQRRAGAAESKLTKATETTTSAVHLNNPEGTTEIVNARRAGPILKEPVKVKKEFSLPVDSVKNKETVKEPFLLPVKTDSSAIKTKVARQGNKWGNYISIRIGRSNYNGSYSRASAPLQYNSGGLNSGTGSTPSGPSKAAPGLFFSVGYGVRKGVGKRFQLGAGLQYSYYSVSSTVGSLQTSGRTVFFNTAAIGVSQFYTDSGQHSYHNKFGVLELPVHLQYKLLKALPLWVSAGVAYGRLLTSTALTYDAVSGTYYLNKENNRRHHLNFYSAIQYQIKSRGKLKIEAGPVVQYNLLGVQRNASPRSPRLFSAGLKTDIFF